MRQGRIRAGQSPGKEAEKAMKGIYYVCPACRKSYSDKKEHNKAEKEILICPNCGSKMQAVQYFVWR